MNRRQMYQVSLAALIVLYTIAWLLLPGGEASKILAIIFGVSILIALYVSYRAEEKNKRNSDE